MTVEAESRRKKLRRQSSDLLKNTSNVTVPLGATSCAEGGLSGGRRQTCLGDGV